VHLLVADVIGWLNDVTDGNLLLWKVVFATVVFALAGLQVVMAARFWGVGAVPVSPGTAVKVHRYGGRVTLILAVLVAFTCLVGPAGPTSPTRVLLHSLFGALVFALLAVKFTVLRVARKGDRFLPLIGSALFLTFGAIWATSVADYVMTR
jgi:hypothetical protein